MRIYGDATIFIEAIHHRLRSDPGRIGGVIGIYYVGYLKG